VEVKLNPPTSREFNLVDSLVLSMSEIDNTLIMNYFFNTRGIDMSNSSMQVQKKTKVIEQKINSKQYLLYGKSLNQDFILESINSVLNEVKSKML
jgi:hypothetical protein